MRKLIIFWSGIILAVIVFWNTNCSGSIFGKTEAQMIVTNWETEYEISYLKIMYIGATTNEITNFTANYTNNRSNTFSWVFIFKPMGLYSFYSYSNGTTNDYENGSYAVNQFDDKITLYSSETLQFRYIFSNESDLRLKNMKVYSNGSYYDLRPAFTNNIGGNTNLIFYDIEYKLKQIVF